MPTNQYISVSNAYGQDIFVSISDTDGQIIVQRGDEAGKQGFVCKIQTVRKNTPKVLTEHHFTKITHGERASFPVAGLLASEVRISIWTREANLYMNHPSMSDWRFIVISDGRATRIGNADHGQYWMEFGICYYPGEHDCLNTTFHNRVGQMNHDERELTLENGQCGELVTVVRHESQQTSLCQRKEESGMALENGRCEDLVTVVRRESQMTSLCQRKEESVGIISVTNESGNEIFVSVSDATDPITVEKADGFAEWSVDQYTRVADGQCVRLPVKEDPTVSVWSNERVLASNRPTTAGWRYVVRAGGQLEDDVSL